MKRLRLFERRLNLQFADLITLTVGGSVGSGRVGSFLSFLLLSLKPPPQFCRFFHWFAVRHQSFFATTLTSFCANTKPDKGNRFKFVEVWFGDNVCFHNVLIFALILIVSLGCVSLFSFQLKLLLFILFPAVGAASLYSLCSCRCCSPLSGKWLGSGPRVAVTE